MTALGGRGCDDRERQAREQHGPKVVGGTWRSLSSSAQLARWAVGSARRLPAQLQRGASAGAAPVRRLPRRSSAERRAAPCQARPAAQALGARSAKDQPVSEPVTSTTLRTAAVDRRRGDPRRGRPRARARRPRDPWRPRPAGRARRGRRARRRHARRGPRAADRHRRERRRAPLTLVAEDRRETIDPSEAGLLRRSRRDGRPGALHPVAAGRSAACGRRSPAWSPRATSRSRRASTARQLDAHRGGGRRAARPRAVPRRDRHRARHARDHDEGRRARVARSTAPKLRARLSDGAGAARRAGPSTVPLRAQRVATRAAVDAVGRAARAYLEQPLRLTGAGEPLGVSPGRLAGVLALEVARRRRARAPRRGRRSGWRRSSTRSPPSATGPRAARRSARPTRASSSTPRATRRGARGR